MRRISLLLFLLLPLLFAAQVCPTPPVLESIDVEANPTGRHAADGALTVGVAGGTPTHLVLTSSQGGAEQQLPMGSLTGVSPGTYSAVLVDVDGCVSNALDIMVPYALCCGSCQVADADSDGLCDDVDNCANRKAINYADPANSACIIPGCMDPAFTEYDAEATTDDGSCATLASTCVDVEMDGYTYSAVEIGDQCWFAENLRTTVYADGTAIPEVTDYSGWSDQTAGARCDYDNDAGNVSTYGRLYNWHAVDDPSGLCPSGWHVPTDGEWTNLKSYITSQGFAGAEGTALKAATGWAAGNSDHFGFSALPAGYRGIIFGSGTFSSLGYSTGWWSSSPKSGQAWRRTLTQGSAVIGRSGFSRRNGLSVRCLKDPAVLGCTDPDYLEYDAEATADDGSCATLASTCVDVEMDGYTYSAVEIGDQCWFAENLRTTVYADGTAIPEVTDYSGWSDQTTGARCDYNNDVSNVATYGRLYNWYAVDDARGLCPSGWHVPTDGEWTELEDHITSQGFSETPTALKSTGGWYDNGNGTDDFGFSALPGGLRDDLTGDFTYAGYNGNWWSSSPYGGSAWFRNLSYFLPVIYRYYYGSRNGFSVRCLRDAE